MLILVALLAAIGAVQCLVLLALLLTLGRVQRHSRALQAAASTLHSAAAKLEAIAAREPAAPQPQAAAAEAGSAAPARRRVHNFFAGQRRTEEQRAGNPAPAREPATLSAEDAARRH